MTFANDCVKLAQTCLNDIPDLLVDQLTEGSIELELRNRTTQEIIDLTVFGIKNDPEPGSSSPSSSSPGTDEGKTGVEFWVKEFPDAKVALFNKDARIVDAEKGIVALDFLENETRFAGIWVGQAIVFENGKRKQLFPIHYIVNPTADTLNAEAIGSQALTVAEIRMIIRDTCAEQNFLLDIVEFTTSEIALAIRRTVDRYNEMPPPVTSYTPATFPFRYHLSIGVIGLLYRQAAYHLRRNDLDYSAGGLSIRETADHSQYEAIGTDRLKEFDYWAKRNKVAENMDFAIVQGSPYRFGVSER